MFSFDLSQKHVADLYYNAELESEFRDQHKQGWVFRKDVDTEENTIKIMDEVASHTIRMSRPTAPRKVTITSIDV